ncbi:hypothetical protein MUG84_21230 [Paenibacillus sp. KQZ6P-2]|uniref:DUF6199 domain-containing protein n=1 Tax=Paenibacillus mangrovi TaxID=2931978 RepID=A0A9X1WY46_9BACL|nr:hypothetical protein [Paenibacillus mangrovi]MCJ8014239.1 hypothetical protein [Paenibacillus mangrovi]
MKLSTLIIIFCLIVAAFLLTWFAKSYFSEKVFYLNTHMYKKGSEQDNLLIYHTFSGPSIEVHVLDQDRKVIINNEEYSIQHTADSNSQTYQVTYPSGHRYKVEDQSGYLLSFDEKGELFIPGVIVYSGNWRILQPGEEEYVPSSLVTAAYADYHYKRGNVELFILSFVLLIYGWCGFRYEKFQNFMFLISLRSVWVNDPEPSDFYYFMCKVGGVLTMIGAFILAISSLELDIFQ